MRYALKEARLQTPVPTNRTGSSGDRIQRLYRSDEVTHHTDVQGRYTVKSLCSRSSGYWGKEYVLTWGDLSLYELLTEKSAEVIVLNGNEP